MSVLHDLYAVLWLATWGNNTAWLESLAVIGAAAFVKRDAIGRRLAAWWAKHHGPHAIAQHREALRQHEEAKQAASEHEETNLNRPVMFRAGGTPGAVIAPLAESAGPVTLLADISEFEPQIADAIYLAWSKAIVIRAMYGDQHDDGAWYGGQRRAALHAGGARFVGVYQYLVAGQSGAAQAQAFRDLVGAIRPGEVFVADFEEGQRSMLTDWFNKMVALYGHAIRPYLWTYTGLNFGAAQGVLPVEWIAAYGQGEPSTPHKLWQFTSSYDVPGVGSCDASVFHGTIDQVAALAYPAQHPKPPKPPADWTYGAPRNLQATAGHTSVRLSWEPPAGAPVPPAEYEVFIYRGTHPDRLNLVHHYPRIGASPWQGGSLEQGKTYTAHVVAAGPHGTHVKPGVYASAVFTTA